MKQYIIALLAIAMLVVPVDATALTLMQQRKTTSTQTRKKTTAKAPVRKTASKARKSTAKKSTARRTTAKKSARSITLLPRFADCRTSAPPCRKR